MDALIFSWSGSFRERYEDREADITHIIDFVHDRGFEVGLVAAEEKAELQEVPELFDFVVEQVANIVEVVGAFTSKYDKVFFVSDIQAELASVNQTGAFTVGYNADETTADDLGGIGPNYIVDSLDELEQILLLETMS